MKDKSLIILTTLNITIFILFLLISLSNHWSKNYNNEGNKKDTIKIIKYDTTSSYKDYINNNSAKENIKIIEKIITKHDTLHDSIYFFVDSSNKIDTNFVLDYRDVKVLEDLGIRFDSLKINYDTLYTNYQLVIKENMEERGKMEKLKKQLNAEHKWKNIYKTAVIGVVAGVVTYTLIK